MVTHRCGAKENRPEGQCKRCIYRDAQGPIMLPLIQKIEEGKGKRKTVKLLCLTFRDRLPEDRWKDMELVRADKKAKRLKSRADS